MNIAFVNASLEARSLQPRDAEVLPVAAAPLLALIHMIAATSSAFGLAVMSTIYRLTVRLKNELREMTASLPANLLMVRALGRRTLGEIYHEHRLQFVAAFRDGSID